LDSGFVWWEKHYTITQCHQSWKWGHLFSEISANNPTS